MGSQWIILVSLLYKAMALHRPDALLSHCNLTAEPCVPGVDNSVCDYDRDCRTNPRFAPEHVLPDEWELMLDSHDYQNLIENSSPVWVKKDVDGDGGQWSQRGGICQNDLRVCSYTLGSQNNWVFSQHIKYPSRDIDTTEIYLNITVRFSQCTSVPACTIDYVTLYRFDTNTIASTSNQTDPANYIPLFGPGTETTDSRIQQVGVTDTTILRTFTTPARDYTGFYLGIQDNGTCGQVKRIYLYYTPCIDLVDGLVYYPELVRPPPGSPNPNTAEACCAPNSHNMTSLIFGAYSDGRCERNVICVCDSGYKTDGTGKECKSGFNRDDVLLSHCNRTNDHHNYCGSTSCAPDDYNVVCRTNPRFAQEHILPDEWELMLDSRDYLTLVEDAIPVWVKRDVDGDGKQWGQLGGLCRYNLAAGSCQLGLQDNWVFSQHIKYPAGSLSTEVYLNVTLNSCLLTECNRHFVTVYRFDTNTIVPTSNQTDPANYVPLFGPGTETTDSRLLQNSIVDITVVRSFKTPGEYTGFYLGLRDNGTCGLVKRIYLYYTPCKDLIDGLVYYPELVRPPAGSPNPNIAEACCAPYSHNTTSLVFKAYSGGGCERNVNCECDPGYQLDETRLECIRTCGVPDEPINRIILEYGSIATNEGSMITFQCNAGLIPEGEMTAFCNSSGFWSPDPTAVNCRKVEGVSVTAIVAAVAVVVVLTFFVAIFLGIIGNKLFHKCMKKTEQSSTQPPIEIEMKQMEPVYEEIDFCEADPDTEVNVAYGQRKKGNLEQLTKRVMQSSTQHSTEIKPLGPVYGEPETYIPDPGTVRNTIERHDGNEPDPDTMGNVAYGQSKRDNLEQLTKGAIQSSTQHSTDSEINLLGPVYGEPETYIPDPDTVRNTIERQGDNGPDPDTMGNVAYSVRPLHSRR